MTTITVDEFRNQVDRYLAMAVDGEVVLTQEGKPWLVLQGFGNDSDRESTAFARSPEFWQMIQQRRAEKGIPWEEAKRTLEVEDS